MREFGRRPIAQTAQSVLEHKTGPATGSDRLRLLVWNRCDRAVRGKKDASGNKSVPLTIFLP